ncbi:hypothetical protein [Pseudonocardia sp. N23]|uniref:hypothetical protein n=1 Tax=Pseudonocardia sp. N23 TaxID=1987376 RepID=UPI000BFD327D|nr:hypothetical protein [Pseudonocardia sp. N23]GAY09827.1 hypothetical protein TOK_4182 [Pseudonocardia sp. N23]
MIRELMPQPSELWAVITDAAHTTGRIGRVVAWALDAVTENPSLIPIVARNGASTATIVDGEDVVELYDRRAEADNRLSQLIGETRVMPPPDVAVLGARCGQR